MIITNESIDEMKKKLVIAEEIIESDLADKLNSIGFECIRCGECCRSVSGDNRVIVFPVEVENIIKTNKLNWNDVCKPSKPMFIDETGMLHAFEWELNRHESEDCVFLNNNINTCKIYDQRPWICRTYPFYLVFENRNQKSNLMVSDCQGCGGSITGNEALDLAISLKKRLVEEIQEEVQVFEHLKNYDDWNLIIDYSQSGMNKKSRISVHDSCGTHICNNVRSFK